MKKHLLFVAVLFACNIGKIFAQQHHHQNQQHHNNNGGYGGNNNNNGGGYNPYPNQQNSCIASTMVLKFLLQNPFKTQAIVDGNNYGSVQNLYDGITLTAGKHFIQLYKKGNRNAGGYMIFSGDVWLNANTITTASLNYETGLVMNEILMYNNQCGSSGYYPVCNYAVDERTFCTFKNVVNNAWFDSDKQKMICDFLSRNYVNSNQVEQLLSMIDFESTKLNIAKEAYTKVVDKNNYYTVFNQFDFESSKRELSDFMARC